MMAKQTGDCALRLSGLTAAVLLSLGTLPASTGATAATSTAKPVWAALAQWRRGVDERQARLASFFPAARESVAAPAAIAGSRTVSTCADSGSGSLRAAVGASASGDTVDMSGLNCSPITLSTGAIQVTVANLTVLGKTQQTLAIDGGYKAAIFEHTGTGTLSVSDVTLRHGYYGAGGCIFSKGSIALTRVTVTNCKAVGYAGYAAGGGVFATRT